jgi:hypothetical protein
MRPTLDTKTNYYLDPESGFLLEQAFLPNGQPSLFPQLLYDPPLALPFFASDAESGKVCLDVLRLALGETVTLVEKVREGAEFRFYATPLTWDSATDSYQSGGREGNAKPPKTGGIWVELLDPSPTTQGGPAKLPPRIFRRPAGQLVCRVSAPGQAKPLLSLFRLNLHTIVRPSDLAPQEVSGGSV